MYRLEQPPVTGQKGRRRAAQAAGEGRVLKEAGRRAAGKPASGRRAGRQAGAQAGWAVQPVVIPHERSPGRRCRKARWLPSGRRQSHQSAPGEEARLEEGFEGAGARCAGTTAGPAALRCCTPHQLQQAGSKPRAVPGWGCAEAQPRCAGRAQLRRGTKERRSPARTCAFVMRALLAPLGTASSK